MSVAPSTQIASLRQRLAEKRAELQRLERERAAKARQLAQLSAQIEKIVRKAPTPLDADLAKSVAAADSKAVKRHLAAGADANSQDREGTTPLLTAVYARAPVSIIRELIRAGADVNLADFDGNTPLIVSVNDEQLSTVQELVKRGADPNARNDEGDTPLTNAACWGSGKIVEFLLRHGADRHLPDGAGIPASELARQQGHKAVARALDRTAP